ncbi:MAG: urease accessory UreF family protein [Candidatus Competibacteraceae bacterium]|nr:urease accessory UreF family protein [Candidatus Competibacteraceae bacterium]
MTTDPALLRLLQLSSPALPVGAYAYSQGLETAVERGWVSDPASTADWLQGLLEENLVQLDLPALARLLQAWSRDDRATVACWNHWLGACRETAELRAEDHHLGAALARLLTALGLQEARDWQRGPTCFATSFALAAVRWHIPLEQAALGYLWTWAEAQAGAAAKLVPLGQTQLQRLLSRLQPDLVAAAQRGLALDDQDLGASAPGLALGSCLHEIQYCRLFRS